MNFEAIIEKYTVSILDHKIKTLIAILLLVFVATIGARFLETPSGYRGFVESGQPNYQDILNLEEKYGMIQPIPESLLDKDFIVEGWKIRDAVTGIKRIKREEYENFDLSLKVSVEEEARVGWTLSRANYITLTKIAIPLLFLLFLNYYTLFLSFHAFIIKY